MALLTTTAGSFPKPGALVAARERFEAGGIGAAALREEEDRATAECVSLQESLGLDLLVDGEMDRVDAATFLAGRLEGVEVSGPVRVFGHHFVRRPRIVGAVRRLAPLTVERFRFTRDRTARPVKAVLVGPYTLVASAFDEHYGSRERCIRDVAAAIAEEVRDLVEAGCREIQIDETALGARRDEIGLAREAIETVRAAAGRARLWLHVAWADLRDFTAELFRLPAVGFHLEMANSRYDLLDEIGRTLPEDRLLVAGVVDVLTSRVERREEVRARIERLATRVPPERLFLAPDSGLGLRTAREAREKVAVLVEAAAATRAALPG